MPYASLGSRKVVAGPDSSGFNPGNLTSMFDTAVLSIQVPYFELYRAVVTDTTPGCTATVSIDAHPTSYNVFGSGAEWDPSQPPILLPGQQVFFFWDLAVGSTPPVATLWFRYDTNLGVQL